MSDPREHYGAAVAMNAAKDAEIERLRAELADERKYNRIVCEMSEACVQCQDLRALLAEARQCVRAECGEMEQFACRPGMHPDAYLWANERISYYAGLLTRIDAALAGCDDTACRCVPKEPTVQPRALQDEPPCPDCGSHNGGPSGCDDCGWWPAAQEPGP